MNRSLVQRLPFFYGWVIVGCAMCSSVVRQAAAVATLSIFIVPMAGEFGWSRTGISGAVSLGGVLGAFVAPFIGPLFDRHGSRALLVASAVTVSGCCVALAGTQGLLWFYVAFGLSRLMFSTPFEIGTTSAVTKWFVRRRARAMSLLIVSTGAGLTVVPLVVAAVIDVAGWRAAWLTPGRHRHRARRRPAMVSARAQTRGCRARTRRRRRGPGTIGIGDPRRRCRRSEFHQDPGAAHPGALAADGLHPCSSFRCRRE